MAAASSQGLSPGFMAARYHSLAIDPATLPADFEVTATAEDGTVLMGMRHRTLPLEGVQFHPESVLTPEGPHLLANFLRQAGEGEAGDPRRRDRDLRDARPHRPRCPGGVEPARRAADPGSVGRGPTTGTAPVAAARPVASASPSASGPSEAAGEAISEALHRVVEGGTLTFDEARAAMGAVMDGEATPSQLAALLVALRMRGETVDELAGFAAAMRDRVVHVDAPPGTVDTCGTGGDRSGTFNISTAAALVVAAAGVPVAKHGNRAITSRSGSTDVLDALGVRVDHDADSAAAALRHDGFAFLFAPSFHPAMRHAGPTRREIGVRTAFNLLGPLTNPAGARRQVIGVGAADAAPRLAEVVRRLGTDRTLLVHGAGIDEIPLDGSGVLYDVTPAGVQRRPVDAIALAALGIAPAATSALAGGTPTENAALIEAVLDGATGPRRDVVLLNAAAALVAAGRVRPTWAPASAWRRRPSTGAARRASSTGSEPPGVRDEAAVAAASRPTSVEHGAGRDDRTAAPARRPRRRRRDRRTARRRRRQRARVGAAAGPRRRGRIGPRAAAGRGAAGRAGCHVIAEVKRRSPSAGPIAPEGDDLVARARAYVAGGAAMVSVLCEPHWFGGSIDDLRAVRAAIAAPVLAKEFVVDPRQLPVLRAAGRRRGAAPRRPPSRAAARLARAARPGPRPGAARRGAWDARDRPALASGARLIGVNNRDLRSLAVDPETAVRLRPLIPDDRIAVAESGVREPGTVAAGAPPGSTPR